ncbi:hypothetical protein BCV70DRAFT_3172 [Testicularia cyperi]|uniref:Uncharacterized protein n=1 Tax=Testicularia cyperi TaxID=1882483 RepID=A0A317XZ25_9BASI|nr:hypothetical protein BCV70DRAFT_3172 [Testicularia cyperi]
MTFAPGRLRWEASTFGCLSASDFSSLGTFALFLSRILCCVAPSPPPPPPPRSVSAGLSFFCTAIKFTGLTLRRSNSCPGPCSLHRQLTALLLYLRYSYCSPCRAQKNPSFPWLSELPVSRGPSLRPALSALLAVVRVQRADVVWQTCCFPLGQSDACMHYSFRLVCPLLLSMCVSAFSCPTSGIHGPGTELFCADALPVHGPQQSSSFVPALGGAKRCQVRLHLSDCMSGV